MSKLSFPLALLFAGVLAVVGAVEGAKGNRDALYVVPFVVFSLVVARWNYRKMIEEDREELREIRERQPRLKANQPNQPLQHNAGTAPSLDESLPPRG